MPVYHRLPLPWDSQPQQGAAELNPELVQSAGLQDVFLAGRSIRGGVVIAGAPAAIQYGVGPVYSNTTTAQSTGISFDPSAWSVILAARFDTLGSYAYSILSDSTALRGISLNDADTSPGDLIIYDGTKRRAPTIGLVNGEVACVGFGWDGANCWFAKNGFVESVAGGSLGTGNGWHLKGLAGNLSTFVPTHLGFFSRCLTREQFRNLTVNPNGLFADQSIWIPASAGGGGVSGTLATTNANDTSAASGTTTVTGTVAATNANDTSAASGTTTIVGTLATTNANDTSAASGSVGGDVTGTVAYTNANDTVSASGTTTVTGTLARTNADDSAAASGWAGAITGTLAYTNANDIADASGIAETGFLAGIGGWGPIRRRKRKDEDEDNPQEVPEVVEVVAAKPRKTLKLADIMGKRQAAQITSVDLSEAVAASKKRKRQQEDELLLLM